MFVNSRLLSASVLVVLLLSLLSFDTMDKVAAGQDQERVLLPLIERNWLRKEIHGYVTLQGRPLASAVVRFFNGPQAFGGTQSDENGFYNLSIMPQYHDGTTYGVLLISAYGDSGQLSVVERYVSAYQWPEELLIETIAMDPIDLISPEEGAIVPCNAETEFVWEMPSAVKSDVSQVELEVGAVFTHNQHTYGPPAVRSDVTGKTSTRLYVPCGTSAEDLQAGGQYFWHIGVTTRSGLYRTTDDRGITMGNP